MRTIRKIRTPDLSVYGGDREKMVVMAPIRIWTQEPKEFHKAFKRLEINVSEDYLTGGFSELMFTVSEDELNSLDKDFSELGMSGKFSLRSEFYLTLRFSKDGSSLLADYRFEPTKIAREWTETRLLRKAKGGSIIEKNTSVNHCYKFFRSPFIDLQTSDVVNYLAHRKPFSYIEFASPCVN